MKNSKSFIAFAVSAALSTFPSVAVANDRDVQATTIPASACQTSNAVGEAPAQISNGAYIIRGASTGTVTLYCPLPINANTTADLSNDNDITRYRVYYRDSDGIANASEVRTQLYYRNNAGQVTASPVRSSNSNVITTNTHFTVPLNEDLVSNGLYYFIVTIRRNNTVQDPAFGGIDFP